MALLGVQEPRLRVCPRYTRTEGEDAAFLSASYGLIPDEWQSSLACDTLAVRPDGSWVSSRAGWSVPRQNGKNVVLEIVELYKMVVLGRKILHTAHQSKTATKSFQRLVGFFESRAFPELGAMVKEIRRSAGQEAITLHEPGCDQQPRCGCDWGSIEFIARSQNSGRGYTADDLVFDEAQELDETAYAALLPTVSASPSGNPQQIMCGTPPGPSNRGEVFTRLRRDAMSGKSRRTLWCEWSFDPESDPDDVREHARANPAYGIRLHPQVIEDERAAMDDMTFIRERGGVWASTGLTTRVITSSLWASLHDPHSRPGELVALAVDVTPEADYAAIVIASKRDDGRVHVELVEHRAGTGWVVERVAGIVERHVRGPVVLDGASPAAALADGLRARGVLVTLSGFQDMGRACVGFLQLVNGDQIRHVGQPQLAAAVSVARKRPIGRDGLWGWGRAISGADISPTVAATLAVWACMSTQAKPQPRQRSGRSVFRG